MLTRLGEAQLLLPAMVLASAWLTWRQGPTRLALGWLAGTAAAAVITTLSKVAFIGYGIGLPALDFTGISGHAMFAAAVLPPLLRLSAGTLAFRWQTTSLLLGYGLAAAVAVSRVMVEAHSWSEVAAGFALGASASGLALLSAQIPAIRIPRWVPPAVLAWGTLGGGRGTAVPHPRLGDSAGTGTVRPQRAVPALANAPGLPAASRPPAATGHPAAHAGAQAAVTAGTLTLHSRHPAR